MELFVDTQSTPAVELFVDTLRTPAVELFVDTLRTPAVELFVDTPRTPAVEPLLQTLHGTQHSVAVLTFAHSASPSCMKTVSAIVAELEIGWHCGTPKHKMALWNS